MRVVVLAYKNGRTFVFMAVLGLAPAHSIKMLLVMALAGDVVVETAVTHYSERLPTKFVRHRSRRSKQPGKQSQEPTSGEPPSDIRKSATRRIELRGIRVMRIAASDVLDDRALEGMLVMIAEAAKGR